MNEYEFLMMQSSYQLLSGCIAAYEDEKKQ